jgi:hypothetical protein
MSAEGLRGLIGPSAGNVGSFWNAAPKESEPLTRESFERGMAKMKERFDWEVANPHGSPDNPHLVSPKTKARGYGICVECGAPIGAWPHEKSEI